MSTIRLCGRRAALCVAALLLLPVGAAAQTLPAPAETESAAQQARYAVRDALELGQQRQFSAAVDRLNRARLICTTATDAPGCENLVVYSLAYVHQVEASREPGDRPALLQRAARYYQEVVNADPGYQDAVYNLSLVLRELGPQEWQERYYRAAPDLDPQRRTQHLVFLGDYHASQDRWREAVGAYEAALNEDPGNRAAAAALVEVGAVAPVAWTSRLMEHAAAWEQPLPDVATEAYRTVLRRLPRGEDQAAERAFLRLAVLTSGRVRPEVSAIASTSPLHAAADALEEFLYGEWQPMSGASFWLQTEERRRALAEAALRAGTHWVAQGRPDRAQECWRAAASYTDRNWPEALDLQRELALLYFRHEDLDPTGERFRELEQEIFEGKGVVLRAADHAAAQRYHTALGLIYAERGEWTGPPAHNAIDQLTWALAQAEVMDDETGGHRPLPEIRSVLAAGLAETGDGAGARRLHLQAALGYLDTDALEEATAAVERGGESAQGARLRELIAVRRRLDGLGPEGGGAIATACDRRVIDAATHAAAAAGGDAFAARQRFKLLGDCAHGLPAGPATAYQAEAFELVVRQRLPLVGTADLRRFQRARASVAEAAGLPTAAPGLRYNAAEAPPDGIAVSLPGRGRTAFLTVPAEEATAARVVRLLAPAADGLRVRVDAGTVELESGQAGQFSPELMAELSRLEGVKAVRVGAARREGGG